MNLFLITFANSIFASFTPSRLEDSRTGNIYDYSRKQDLGFSEIITPDNAPAWVKDRQQLWAKNELANKRRDARVAKEILVALPRELDINEQLYLVRKFVAENLTPLGVIADINAHELDPNILPADDCDDWNPHCHILISTQHLADGEFGQKITELNDRNFVIGLRKSWADLVNERLEAVGSLERVDHRSNQAQGIDLLPQIHLGHRVCQLRKRGIATDRGDLYHSIEQRNQERKTITLSVGEAIRIAMVKKRQAVGLANRRKKALLQSVPTQPAIIPDSTQTNSGSIRQPNPSHQISGSDVVRNSMPEQMKATIAKKQEQKKKLKKPWWQKATDFVFGEGDTVKHPPKPEVSQAESISSLRKLAKNPAPQSNRKKRVQPNPRRIEQPQTKEQRREVAHALIKQVNNLREVDRQLKTTMTRLAVLVEKNQIRILALDFKGNINQPEKLILTRGKSGWQLTKYELSNYQRTKLLQVLKQVEQTKSNVKAQVRTNVAQPPHQKSQQPDSSKNDTSMSRYLQSPPNNKSVPKPTKSPSKGFEL